MILWFQTRIMHFLKACVLVSEILPALYDSTYTHDIRVKDRDTLFTPENTYLTMLMANIRPIFEKQFFLPLDQTSGLVSTVYNCSGKFAEALEDVYTSLADFLLKSWRLIQMVIFWLKFIMAVIIHLL